MSESDKSSDQDKLKALATLSFGAWSMALQALSILAVRGLLHPDEAEKILSPMLQQLDALPEPMLSTMPYKLTEGFAEIKRIAAVNWKGG